MGYSKPRRCPSPLPKGALTSRGGTRLGGHLILQPTAARLALVNIISTESDVVPLQPQLIGLEGIVTGFRPPPTSSLALPLPGRINSCTNPSSTPSSPPLLQIVSRSQCRISPLLPSSPQLLSMIRSLGWPASNQVPLVYDTEGTALLPACLRQPCSNAASRCTCGPAPKPQQYGEADLS